jgi:perosamine synthetase
MIVKKQKNILQKDINNVVKLLKKENLSGFNSGPGKSFYGGENIQLLEKQFCDHFNCRYAISVNSWTSGLEIAVASLKLKANAEVICSPWSMSATVAAIANNNCVPVFADIDPLTFNIDPNKIEQKITKKTGAILVTEMYGQSCDIERIIKIAKKYKLSTISDTAQAIGSKVKNKFTGTHTDIGGFSFNWHKHLNCGEGGMVITNNGKLAKQMMMLRNHGEGVDGDFGHNFRMTEVCASLIRDQLPRLVSRIKARNLIVEQLKARVHNNEITFPTLYKGNTHVYCTLPLLVRDRKLRDILYEKLKLLYPVRKTFSRGPLNLLRACNLFYSKMPIAEQLPNMLLDFDMNYAYTPRDAGIIADFLNNT